MKAFMLDLETMSTKPNAVVTAVGIAVFDPRGTGVEAAHHWRIGLWEEQRQRGMDLSGDTVSWWLGGSFSSPDEAARKALFEDQLKPEQALDFIDELFDNAGDVEVWGNGADFDNIILGNMYAAYGRKKPWSYSMNRCYRTMKNIPLPKTFVAPIVTGTAHNAMDDAVNQALRLQAIYKALNL